MVPLLTVKFIYSEKATKFCEISTVDLSCVVTVKSTVEISQNFQAFSEYMNFKKKRNQNLVFHKFASHMIFFHYNYLLFFFSCNYFALCTWLPSFSLLAPPRREKSFPLPKFQVYARSKYGLKFSG